jgi:hypothetical protein
MSNDAVVQALTPLLQRLRTLDLGDTEATREALNREFPLSGDWASELRALTETGLKEGWLCGREAGSTRFSRVAKPDAAHGYSVDAVLLWGDGPWHKHTNGEVNCMLAIDGEPEFCGYKEGWAVFAPGSAHVPSVKGGKMLIFYMLPGGAVEWKQD